MKFHSWVRVIIVTTLCALAGFIIPSIPDRVLDARPEQTPAVTYSTERPDESKESADSYKWSGTGTDAYKLRIPSLGIDSYIQKMGADQNGKIAVPTNVHLAGWYQKSSVIGTKGISVIVGHVSGKNTDGVFKHLNQLKPDDTFEVERGDGKRFFYQVMSSKQIKESEAANYLFSKSRGVESQLNLITCGGTYDTVNHQYEDRIIISAKLL